MTAEDRQAFIRRGLWLNYFTIAYNALEAIASLAAGVAAGSIALLGFGVDSVIELAASGAAQWRLRSDLDSVRRAGIEHTTRRTIGVCFLALAAYIGYESLTALWRHEQPAKSVAGIVILAASVIVMPMLARAKRRVALAMGSRALTSEARQTSLCAYLSAIALVGIALNALFGWWWADPVAALAMLPIVAREGVEGFAAEKQSSCC
jgi:divalent metal cation (Fe/Co/Zn/Cd) transporter